MRTSRGNRAMNNERGHIHRDWNWRKWNYVPDASPYGHGLDTGFQPGDDPMEWHDLSSQRTPKIVKRPQFCKDLETWLDSGFVIDHAIIPMRNLKDASDSRRRRAKEGGGPDANGGLFDTSDPDKQEEVLAALLGKLLHTIAIRHIPHSFLDFDMIADTDYLFRKLSPVFSRESAEFSKDRFMSAHSVASARRERSRSSGRWS
jgi:hypothetical protein